MARNFTTNLILGGDPRGGINALRSVRGEMDRTGRRTRTFSDRFRQLRMRTVGLNSSLTRLAGILGLSLSFGAAIRGVQRLASDADGIGKLAERTNFAVEALQEYRFAAEQGGVSSQQFDDSILRLNRRLGLFIQTGGGPAANAIKRLGIEMTDAAGEIRRTDDVFLDIAERISNLTSVQEQAAVASEFFGDRTGPLMVNMLRQGKIGIEELAEQVRATGSIMSEEGVAAATRYQDTMNILGRQMRGVATQIFEGLIPGLQGTMEMFIRTSNEGEGLVRAGERIAEAFNIVIRTGVVVGATFRSVGTAVAGLAAMIVSGFQIIINGAQAAINSLAVASDRLIALDFRGAAEAIRGTGQAMAEATEQARHFGDAGLSAFTDDIPDIWREATARLNEIESALHTTGETGKRSGRTIAEAFGDGRDGQAGTELAKAAAEAERFRTALEDLEDEMAGGNASAIRQWQRSVQNANQLLAAGVINIDDWNRALDLYRERLDRATRPADDFAKQIEKIIEFAERSQVDPLAEQIMLVSIALQEATDPEMIARLERTLEILVEMGNAGEEAGSGIGSMGNSLARALSHALSAQGGRSIGDTIGNALRTQGTQGIQSGLEDAFKAALENMDWDLDDPQVQANLNVGMASLGAAVAGNMGEAIGTAIGGAIGSIWGPLGTQIGAMLGGLIGGVFDSKRPPRFDFAGSRALGDQFMATDPEALTTRMGEFHINMRRFDDDAQAEMRRGISQFHAALAFAVGDAHVEAAREVLELTSFESRFHGDIQDMFAHQLEAVVNEIYDGFAAGIIMAGIDLEDQLQRLADVGGIMRQQFLQRGLGMDDNQTLALVDELSGASETLGETFVRLREATQSLDLALALTGNSIGQARDDLIRFGNDLQQVMGEAMQGGLNRIFQRFFSDEERLDVIGAQASQRAGELLSRLGLDVTEQMLTQSGFRDLFDDLFGTLSPEDTALLIEAGVAIDQLIAAEEQLAKVRGDSVVSAQEQADFMENVRQSTLQIIAPAWAEYDKLAQSIQASWTEAQRLLDNEDDLMAVRRLHTLQLQQFTAGLKQSIAGLNEQLFGDGREMERTSRQIGTAMNSIRDSMIRAIEGVRDWLDRSMLSDVSPLLPVERLAEVERQFNQTFADAMRGDVDAISALPQLADAFLSQAGNFFGTSTSDFDAIWMQVRDAMQQVAGLDVPDAREPTFGQMAAVQTATEETALSALEQARLSGQLVQQMALLARITETTPAEIGAEFGVPIGQLIAKLTGEVPQLTGDALSQYFNDLAGGIASEIDVLLDMEAIATAQLFQLEQINEALSGQASGRSKDDHSFGPVDPPSAAEGFAGQPVSVAQEPDTPERVTIEQADIVRIGRAIREHTRSEQSLDHLAHISQNIDTGLRTLNAGVRRLEQIGESGLQLSEEELRALRDVAAATRSGMGDLASAWRSRSNRGEPIRELNRP